MLKIKLSKLRKVFENLFKEIRDYENINVYYHNDGDGIVSAAIFSKMLDNLGIKHNLFSFIHSAAISKSNEGLHIFLDCVPKEKIGEKMIIIDHHVKEKTKADIYINFRDFFKKGRSNAFYLSLVYNLFWNSDPSLYFISAYQDGALGECIDLIKKVLKKEFSRLYYRGFLNPFLRIIGDVPNVILCTEEFNEKIINLLKDFIDKGIVIIEENSKEILEILEKLNKCMISAIRKVKNIKEFDEKLVVVEMEDPEKLYRFIISYFVLKYKAKIYLFVKGGENAKISLRSREINLVKLMRKIEKRVKISWGGHIQAIGGFLRRKDLNKFIKELLVEIK